jgi:hypothetical protein
MLAGSELRREFRLGEPRKVGQQVSKLRQDPSVGARVSDHDQQPVHRIVAPFEPPPAQLRLQVVEPRFELDRRTQPVPENDKVPRPLLMPAEDGRQRNVRAVGKGPCQPSDDLEQSRRLHSVPDRPSARERSQWQVEAEQGCDARQNDERHGSELAGLDPRVRASVDLCRSGNLPLAQPETNPGVAELLAQFTHPAFGAPRPEIVKTLGGWHVIKLEAGRLSAALRGLIARLRRRPLSRTASDTTETSAVAPRVRHHGAWRTDHYARAKASVGIPDVPHDHQRDHLRAVNRVEIVPMRRLDHKPTSSESSEGGIDVESFRLVTFRPEGAPWPARARRVGAAWEPAGRRDLVVLVLPRDLRTQATDWRTGYGKSAAVPQSGRCSKPLSKSTFLPDPFAAIVSSPQANPASAR